MTIPIFARLAASVHATLSVRRRARAAQARSPFSHIGPGQLSRRSASASCSSRSCRSRWARCSASIASCQSPEYRRGSSTTWGTNTAGLNGAGYMGRWPGSNAGNCNPSARNLESFTRDNPPIARDLKLPDWTCSCRLAYPPPIVPLAALIAPAAAGDPRLHTGDWWQVNEEGARVLRERKEREGAEQ